MRTALVLRAQDFQIQEQEWLIDNWIPRGAITIFDGDPGQGKSLLTLTIAAALTRGERLVMDKEQQPRQPENVLLIGCEDNISSQTLPRLTRAGADLSRVCLCNGTTEQSGDKYMPLLFPGDTLFLRETLANFKPALVVIDPIMAFLHPDVNTASDQAVRLALMPLLQLAEESRAAFLIVRHLNKGMNPRAIYRGGGSIGFVGLARATFIIAPNPEVKDEYCLCQVKNNFGKLAPPLGYRIEGAGGVPVIRWTDFHEFKPDQVLRSPSEELPIDRACAFLKRVLANGHSRPQGELIALAGKEDLSDTTLMRAKTRLGVVSRKLGASWHWSLPSTSDTLVSPPAMAE